jgi:glutamate-1-semialdehyde 2,1-aminomutase
MPDRDRPSRANSDAAFARAKKVLPGGVNSPVRAYKAVGGNPVFIKEGEGCRVTDVDGNVYVDYVMSYGPLIAGHANDRIVAAIGKAAGRGTCFGMPSEVETQLATRIADAFDSIDVVRFVNSGTEAAMSALRLARAATGRDVVIKCQGCYHGHVDGLLVEAGSGALTLGVPSSPGVPKAVASSTLIVAYNDLNAAKQAFENFPDQIACFAVEPIAGNMGVVLPREGYLQGLRELCTKHGTMLLFDEVMTGFRVAYGGAQTMYDVEPDLTCLAKVIGGGLPVGAYGGNRKVMSMVSPEGPVYQAGTLSGNPLAMSAGLAALDICQEEGIYDTLEAISSQLEASLKEVARDAGVPIAINRAGSMIGLFFTQNTGDTVTDFASATACDTRKFATFFHAMLDQGIMLAPSMFEAMFVSLAHDPQAIEQTIDAARVGFEKVARS